MRKKVRRIWHAYWKKNCWLCPICGKVWFSAYGCAGHMENVHGCKNVTVSTDEKVIESDAE